MTEERSAEILPVHRANICALEDMPNFQIIALLNFFLKTYIYDELTDLHDTTTILDRKIHLRKMSQFV